MPELHALPDATPTGALTPEELLLQHAAHLSSQRDRSQLEVSFVHALRSTLGIAVSKLYRLYTPTGDCLAGMVAQADETGARSLDDGLSWPADTASIEHYPALHRCLTSGSEIVSEVVPGGGQEHVFPIVREGNVFFGFLVLQQDTPLDSRQQNLTHGLIHLFCNQLRLLDYSEIDTLTGLLNRKTFDESLLRVLTSLQQHDRNSENVLNLPRRRRRGDAADRHWLGVIDIDHFKTINDTYGHLIGDEVLLMIANMMKTAFRAHDKLFRFGGEEFVVVLKPTEARNAMNIFERFRRQVEGYVFPQVGHLTISTGFAQISVHDLPSAIIDNADEALYWAKHHGRNQVFCYEDLVEAGHLQRRVVESNSIELF